MVKFRYTDEMKDWLRAHSKGVPYDELAPQFNVVFGLNKTARQIQSACHDHGAHNGVYQFKQPKNIDSFKHHRPIGSTRLTKDGYVAVKIAEPCKWDLAHIVEWEKCNGKFDRKKYIIMFADGNRTNYNIQNLRCVSRRVIGCINSEHLMPQNPTPEMFNAVVLLAENKVAMADAYCRLKDCSRNAAAQSLQYHRRKSDPEYIKKRKEAYQRRKQKGENK